MILFISTNYLRKSFIKEITKFFKIDESDITAKLKLPVQVEKIWKEGFYGVDDAVELLKLEQSEELTCQITFDTKFFYENLNHIPVILCFDVPTKTQIQQLRTKINTLFLQEDTELFAAKNECKATLALKELIRD